MTFATLLAGLAGAIAAVALAELAALRQARPPRRRVLSAVVARLGERVGIDPPRGLADRIAAAGVDVPMSEVVAMQTGLAVVCGLVALPLVPAAPGRLGLALLALAPAAGFLAPEVTLHRRARARRRAIEAEIPDVLDLLRVAVAAGLAPRRALAEVGRRHPGTLARELARAAARAQLGEPVHATLEQLGRRCPADGVAPLVAALHRAERHGAPLAQTLAAQAAEARSRRAARRSDQAAKAAPKIQLVVALLLVPAVLLLVAAALIPALAG
ncbi:type II secretion system F family protein [Candidatus Solirubrobacter pratensis]|uniref:type II secretion system F family protein n=1 Tax=Candidatus Solirubrobacter pratensis TaxID=1298857 RepID=UPI0003F516DA|nr:type II secretion system F family protein [Candidatus Solirubrobacter pratensis]